MKSLGKYMVFFVAFLLFTQLIANDENTSAKVEIALEQLGHKSYKVREQATKELIKLLNEDETVAKKLKKLTKHQDPEIRLRIKKVLEELVVGLEWMDPANEKLMKSGKSGKAVKLEFINKSKQAIKIYWIDWSGRRKPWRGKIEPGFTETCERSFESHVWLVTDTNDKGLGIYVLKNEDARLIFKGAPKKE